MLAKSVAALAIIGSASAYVAPMMSLSANRREVIQGAGAAAVVAAPLAANARGGWRNSKQVFGVPLKAPVVTLFDARGCDVPHNEYNGKSSGDMNDQQCVKVSMEVISVDESTAARKLQEFVSFDGKAIDGNVIANNAFESWSETWLR